MDGIRAERRSVSVVVEIPADSRRIFEVLVDVASHGKIDGSGMVQGAARSPIRLAADAEFTMDMRQVGKSYRSFNRVVEFEEGRRTAWESMGTWRGHKVVGGQRWRWVLTPTSTGTKVEHSYVWGYAGLALLTVWLPGYPARARRCLPRSLARLSEVLSGDPSTLSCRTHSARPATDTTRASHEREPSNE